MKLSDYEYYRTDLGVLYCADCLPLLPMLEPVDLVLTDPPYGITQNSWDVCMNIWNVIKKDVPSIIFSHQPYTSKLIINNENFKYELIWEKSKSTGFLDCSYRPLRTHENILIFNYPKTYNPQLEDGEPWYRGKVKRPKSNWGKQKENISNNPEGKRQPRSVLFFPNPNNNSKHPTEKPLTLLLYLLEQYSNLQDLICDPFLGSGTTAVACERLGRKWVGIEISEDFCAIAKKRIEKERQQLKIF